MKCPNCNQAINETDKYCPGCGQKKSDLNRPFWRLIVDSLFEVFDVDGKLFTTLRALLFRPGYVSKCYRDGQRVKFTFPVRIYLVTSVLLFFILSLIKTDEVNNYEKISFLLLPDGVLDEIPKAMIFLLPFYALVLQLLQPKSKYIFNLVFAVHIHTFWYLIFVFFLLLQVLTPFIFTKGYIAYFIVVYLLIYQFMAIKNFFVSSWKKSLFITIVVVGAYLAAISLSLEIVAAIKQEF